MNNDDDGSIEFAIQWRPRLAGEPWHDGYPLSTYGSRQEAAETMMLWRLESGVDYSEYRIVKRRIGPWRPTKVKGT